MSDDIPRVVATAEIPLTGMRGAVARAMMDSLLQTAQFTLHRRIDATGIEEFRKASDKQYSVNDVVLVAASRILLRYPYLNATLTDDVIRQWPVVNLGMAVALSEGLVVPVIHSADQATPQQIATTARDLAARARSRKLTTRDISDGTFTVTNLGAYGVDGFTPIVNPPQVGILGVGRIHRGELTLSLTVDHRAVDGAPAARYLAELSEAIEAPNSIFCEVVGVDRTRTP
jgi:pyruvate dehydrogenase E2 component (dihydrolipoamide acetyltransferase)